MAARAAGFRLHGRLVRAAGALLAVFAAVLSTVLSTVLLGVPSADAAETCLGATITWPMAGQAVAGRTGVYGSAAIVGFQFYKIEFASEGSPEAWSATSDVVRAPARHARLDRWSTDGLADGVYRLKLTVVDTAAQERCRRVVENVRVTNARRSDAPAADAATGSGGDGADRPAERVARGLGAPWPTAAAGRAVLQATAVLTSDTQTDGPPTVVARATSTGDAASEPGAGTAAEGVDAAAVGPTGGISEEIGASMPVTETGAVSDTAAARTRDGDASAADGEPTVGTAIGRRFGKPFLLGFLAVALVMATLGWRALRSADGAGTTGR